MADPIVILGVVLLAAAALNGLAIRLMVCGYGSMPRRMGWGGSDNRPTPKIRRAERLVRLGAAVGLVSSVLFLLLMLLASRLL